MIFYCKKILFIALLIGSCNLSGQDYDRIAFYNVENFFDTQYDSSKYFNSFTPDGDHYWTKTKYIKKRNNIYKVIAALGKWQGVSILGMAEVENKFVIEDLITKTPLKKLGYKIIHFESPDKRGIDVVAIYLENRFKLLKAKAFHITDTLNNNFKTRDILFIQGILQNDTVFIFYNHWPSRYGGMMNTVRLRHLAAETLINAVDSVTKNINKPKIIILGDFNDNPDDKSIKFLLRNNKADIIALPYVTDFNNVRGTIKHNADWAIFDQIFVTKNLTNNKGLHIYDRKIHIFDINFLLTEDLKNLGLKLNRTFTGFTYTGGFSDHLPVYIDIVK
jgi:glutaredoxin-related protein